MFEGSITARRGERKRRGAASKEWHDTGVMRPLFREVPTVDFLVCQNSCKSIFLMPLISPCLASTFLVFSGDSKASSLINNGPAAFSLLLPPSPCKRGH
jgi:hypothetical protein